MSPSGAETLPRRARNRIIPGEDTLCVFPVAQKHTERSPQRQNGTVIPAYGWEIIPHDFATSRLSHKFDKETGSD